MSNHAFYTKVEADLKCSRLRFYRNEYAQVGIQPVLPDVDSALGIIVHQEIVAGMTGKGVDEAARAARLLAQQLCKDAGIQQPNAIEIPLLAYGLVYAFLTRVLPGILREYEIIACEETVYYQGEHGISWSARPDVILKKKVDGTLWYLELKTTSLDSQRFCSLFQHKAQVHLGCLAYEETMKVPIEGVIFQGLNKGGKYEGSYRSRLIMGYKFEIPGATTATYSLGYKKGFKRFLATEYPGGQSAWIDQLPVEEVAETFPVTPPTAINRPMLMRWMRQRELREVQVREFWSKMEGITDESELQLLLDTYFPQNTDACRNALTGAQCEMYECCWNTKVEVDPVASGLYRLRTRT